MSYVPGYSEDNLPKTQTSRLSYRQHFSSFATPDLQSPKASHITNISAITLETLQKNENNEKTKEQTDSEEESVSDISNFSADIDDCHIRPEIGTNKISDSVPALEWHSSDSFPSSNNLTYSYRKGCEIAKSIQKPDAYKEWLDAKRTAKAFDSMKRKSEEKKQQEEKEKRKTEAENKFKEWLANKVKTHEQSRNLLHPKETASLPKTSIFDTNGKEENYKAWLDRKLRQQKSMKETKINEILQQLKLEKLRKAKASEIYGDWLKKAPKKPKPVPLNRGLFSLKGSVSEMYVNPVEWVRIDQSPSENAI